MRLVDASDSTTQSEHAMAGLSHSELRSAWESLQFERPYSWAIMRRRLETEGPGREFS